MRRSFLNSVDVHEEVNTLKEVALYFKVSPSTVSNWKKAGCPSLQQKPYSFFKTVMWLGETGRIVVLFIGDENKKELDEKTTNEIIEKFKPEIENSVKNCFNEMTAIITQKIDEKSNAQRLKSIDIVNTLLAAIGIGITLSPEIQDWLKRLHVDRGLVDAEGKAINLVESIEQLASKLSGAVFPKPKVEVINPPDKPPQQVEPALKKEIRIDLPNLPSYAKPLDMVLIPAGEFMMGSPEEEKDRENNEGLPRLVKIDKPFFMGKYPITQEQWQAVMGNNPSLLMGINQPVESVSWDDCQEFMKRMNRLEQGNFRLPFEAEWEYCCRAGTKTRFYWGNDLIYNKIKEYAWYDGNSDLETHYVGIKKPNAWGLFDMSGNVWEWCQEEYLNYNSNENIGVDWTRITRGGCFKSKDRSCRSAQRAFNMPSETSPVLGFRVVVS